jgi:hypothetical protein
MLRRSVVVVLAALVAGCAPMPKQAFNREASSHIKSIAITRQPNQDKYEAAVIGHPGVSFGLIGGLIAAADITAKSNKLTSAIGTDETRLQERFADDLAQALTAAGYQVTVVPVEKDADVAKASAAVRAHGKYDAMLHANLIGGYWAAGPASNYVPRVLAVVKLHDLGRDRTLFEDLFTYGYAQPQAKSIHLAAESRYAYANIDALVADPPTTRQGLFDGLRAVAAQIAADLKPQ